MYKRGVQIAESSIYGKYAVRIDKVVYLVSMQYKVLKAVSMVRLCSRLSNNFLPCLNNFFNKYLSNEWAKWSGPNGHKR